ncbi:hypothetical protein SAMN05192541_106175 [Bradyrhizobium arachidis]|uniref:Uncharacterized protein n=2 Tax=Bradyrhizobium arachidis TaxID=858423 RepID=A0AAE7NXS4_9BRAD|nr:hypothetical protein WN72_42025 [Bradyrhizobium arachidis]SFU87178.1 hypothetical protein SAMN05192541_106175 [Bradyrhizobium arachidis]
MSFLGSLYGLLSRIARRPDVRSLALLATLVVLLQRMATTLQQLFVDYTSSGWSHRLVFAVEVIAVIYIVRQIWTILRRLVRPRTRVVLLGVAARTSFYLTMLAIVCFFIWGGWALFLGILFGAPATIALTVFHEELTAPDPLPLLAWAEAREAKKEVERRLTQWRPSASEREEQNRRYDEIRMQNYSRPLT